MFTVALLPTAPTRSLLLCQFAYKLLDAFKQAVPPDDRIWHPELKAWELTVQGFHALCDAEAERLNPLPLDVLDYAYPRITTD